MTAPFWVYLVFGLHAGLMAFDEGYFHRKRGLGRWETVGHPLDTLTVMLPTLLTLFAPSETLENWFLGLAGFSCLFITKDEWVHREQSPALEQWLHACLFVLHPVILFAIFQNWKQQWFPVWPLVVALFVFMNFQWWYWNGKSKRSSN